ncbi:MAG: SGNH/GDSL hydrolase family protein [Clostridiales bacterium]|nr:SGNH/GDSL hydrolase family protein [Clostridiales bacterium]
MKKILSLAIALSSILASQAADIKWHSADSLPLLGKGIEMSAAANRYQRLPDSLKTKVKRDAVYFLGTNSAGMAVRFASDAPAINIKWNNLYKVNMNHMTPTGIRGLDLYTLLPDNSWTFVNTARPNLDDKHTEASVISNMDPVMREYMLYLPLYDGIDSLYIGIDGDYTLTQPSVNLPVTEKPVVFYGTSILQGGCANRAGMAHTNILQRRINREMINFGFSGNGQLDLEVAEVLAAIPDPAMYVLDFVPNVNVAQMDTLMVPFVEILQAAHPGIPMLFVEDVRFPHCRFDKKIATDVNDLNVRVKEIFDTLSAKYPNLYFLPTEGQVGYDNEAFVDGIHFTDLGFIRYADMLEPIIRRIIGEPDPTKE